MLWSQCCKLCLDAKPIDSWQHWITAPVKAPHQHLLGWRMKTLYGWRRGSDVMWRDVTTAVIVFISLSRVYRAANNQIYISDGKLLGILICELYIQTFTNKIKCKPSSYEIYIWNIQLLWTSIAIITDNKISKGHAKNRAQNISWILSPCSCPCFWHPQKQRM